MCDQLATFFVVPGRERLSVEGSRCDATVRFASKCEKRGFVTVGVGSITTMADETAPQVFGLVTAK